MTSICFVIQPFDDGPFDRRYEKIIAPAIRAAGLEPYRVDRNPAADIPADEIESGIRRSVVCVADISTDNPNVWYEVGFAAACGKRLCLIRAKDDHEPRPFDIRNRAVIEYDSHDRGLGRRIEERIQAILREQIGIPLEGDGQHIGTVSPGGVIGPPAVRASYQFAGRLLLAASSAQLIGTIEFSMDHRLVKGDYVGEGPIENGFAYIRYEIAEGSTALGWTGVFVMRLPAVGSFEGYWLTHSQLAPGTIDFGRVILRRVRAESDRSDQ